MKYFCSKGHITDSFDKPNFCCKCGESFGQGLSVSVARNQIVEYPLPARKVKSRPSRFDDDDNYEEGEIDEIPDITKIQASVSISKPGKQKFLDVVRAAEPPADFNRAGYDKNVIDELKFKGRKHIQLPGHQE